MSGNDAELWNSINETEEKTEKENELKESALYDFLTQMAASQDEAGGAFRVTEICDIMGWTKKKTRDRIRKLKEHGLIEIVPVMVKAIDDTMRPAKAYRIKDDG